MPLNDAVEFWNSENGLMERIGLLADQVQLGTYNRAVKVYATAVGATNFTITGGLTKNSCSWCAIHVGQTYHRGQFMPELPKHPNCPHRYEIERVGSTPEQAFREFWNLVSS